MLLNKENKIKSSYNLKTNDLSQTGQTSDLFCICLANTCLLKHLDVVSFKSQMLHVNFPEKVNYFWLLILFIKKKK